MSAPTNPRVPLSPAAPDPVSSPPAPLTPPTPHTGAPPAPPPGAPPALLAVDQAADLLDRVVYEQILECIDLDELFHLEQSLAFTASSLPGVSHARSTEFARSLLDRAFQRLPDDIRTYLRAVEALACDGCELCEEEAREDQAREARQARASRSSISTRRGARFKS